MRILQGVGVGVAYHGRRGSRAAIGKFGWRWQRRVRHLFNVRVRGRRFGRLFLSERLFKGAPQLWKKQICYYDTFITKSISGYNPFFIVCLSLRTIPLKHSINIKSYIKDILMGIFIPSYLIHLYHDMKAQGKSDKKHI